MSSDVRGELRAMFDQWFGAIRAKDGGFVDRGLLPEFRCVDAEGRVIDAPAYKAMFAALPADAEMDYVLHEFDVRPLAGGDAACVTGWYHGRITRDEEVLSDKQLRFVSVWERTDDGWKGVFHQIVPRSPSAT